MKKSVVSPGGYLMDVSCSDPGRQCRPNRFSQRSHVRIGQFRLNPIPIMRLTRASPDVSFFASRLDPISFCYQSVSTSTCVESIAFVDLRAPVQQTTRAGGAII